MIITHINYKTKKGEGGKEEDNGGKAKEFRRAVILINQNQMSTDSPANASHVAKDRRNKSCTATIDCDKVREPYDTKKKVLGDGPEISSSEYTIVQVVPKSK